MRKDILQIAVITAVLLVVFSLWGCGKDTEQEKAIKLIQQARKELRKGREALEKRDMQRSERAQGKAINAQHLLQAIGAPAVQPLIALLKDSVASVRVAAVYALGHIGEQQAVVPLLVALKDENAGVRSEAASALGTIGDEQAKETLIAILGDADASVRHSAAVSLWRMGKGSEVQQALEALGYLSIFKFRIG